MINIYNYFLKISRNTWYNLIFYYSFFFLFPSFAAIYSEDIIRAMPIIYILLVLYSVITILLISYIGVQHLTIKIKDLSSHWEDYNKDKNLLKIINHIKHFDIKSPVIRILAIIHYPLYLSIVYYNFIFIIFGFKNAKYIKMKILVPVMLLFITNIFTPVFLLLIFDIILFFKIKKEKKILMEGSI